MEENYQVIDETLNQTEGLEINHASMQFLNETRKWSKFLAVFMFVLGGLSILFSISVLFIGNSLSQNNQVFAPYTAGGPGLVIMTILLSVLYFIPAYFLLQFSNYMKRALKEQNSNILEMSFRNLKSHYKFIGIMLIVIISIYLIIGLIALIGITSV